MMFFILNAIFAFLGILISRKICLKKKGVSSFVCPIGTDCENVLSSKFSKFFNIGIEKIGLIYYSILFLGFLYLSIFNPIPELIFGLFAISFIGFFFSLYMTFVQALYLKSWCHLCLFSAISSTVIFTFATFSLSDYLGQVALSLYGVINYLNIIQLVGVAVGIAAATISTLLIINFLKDFKIDIHEDNKLTILDQIVWLSITVLLVVNLCFYIINPETYLASSQMFAQLVILLVLITNNSFLSLYINPKLIGIRIDMKSLHVFKTFWLRQVALAMGAVSFISWYAILFISFFANISGTDAAKVISYYIAITIIGILVSQLAILLVDKIKITSDNVYKFK